MRSEFKARSAVGRPPRSQRIQPFASFARSVVRPCSPDIPEWCISRQERWTIRLICNQHVRCGRTWQFLGIRYRMGCPAIRVLLHPHKSPTRVGDSHVSPWTDTLQRTRNLAVANLTMNRMHEANRRRWNDDVAAWEERSNREGRWHRCHQEPELAFEGEALQLIEAVTGGLHGKKACVIGSGDSMAAFALAGLGAHVTSTDISEERLAMGSRRAEQLDLSISFVRSDAACLELPDETFDLVCSTNGFFVWIADLGAVFTEVSRVLKPGACYAYYDVHPFQRPWKDQVAPIEIEKPYWSTGPFQPPDSDSFQFNWTLADLLNPMADAGLQLEKIVESSAGDTRYWEGLADGDDADIGLLDWRTNPRAGLPAWLTVAARKQATIPSHRS